MSLLESTLLEQCRRNSFDSKIDKEINTEIHYLVSQIPAPAPDTADHDAVLARNAQETQVLDRLWVLKNAFVECQTLVDLKEFSAALAAIETLQTSAHEFGAEYTDSMLPSDIASKAELLRESIFKNVASLWSESIAIDENDTSMAITVKPAFAEHWDLFSECEPRLQLIDGLLKHIDRLLEAFVALRVQDLEEFETQITLRLGLTPPLDVLTFNVQSFIFGLETLLPPPLYALVAKRNGHNFIRDLVKTALPQFSPTNPEHLKGFKAEVDGLKGLQEVLHSINWFHAHTLSDYAENFESIWRSQREAVYLGKLRKTLSGRFTVAKNEWDWNGEDDDEEEVNDDDDDDKEPPIVIISDFVAETQAKIDKFIALYRALAPGHYGEYVLDLYAATRELHAQINSLPYSAAAYAKLEQFGTAQLGIATDSYAEKIESITRQPLSAKVASKVLAEVEKCAQSATAAGPKVRENILCTIVEQISFNAIRATLALSDITQDQSEQISEYIRGLRGLSAYFNDINDQVPSWIKLLRLEQLLNQPLMGIKGMYDNSMLVDFSTKELVQLIEALFVDSENRSELLYQVSQ